MARYYITVSIPYVNARPHVGYALELVQADVLARLHRNEGDEVRFLGGTDDHALKNVLAAEQAGVSAAELVAENGGRFFDLGDQLETSFDDFIRTSSDPRHAPGVERLWRQTAANGDFYRKWYEGHYCLGCEQFYADADLVAGSCPEHHTAVEWVAEENWFFRLSRYTDQLIEVISSDRLLIAPAAYRSEVLSFLSSGLSDISVSRSRQRARGWGIGVPDDPEQVVYVWWDALANYVTALDYGAGSVCSEAPAYEKWWAGADERIHVIGKGIVRFHAVYWPALLLSAGLPLPTRIYVHPYLTVDGQKISKSAANGADPASLVSSYGSDALRWWLLHDVPRGSDADFTVDRLVACANEDLANGLGNLASRVAAMVKRFRAGGEAGGASSGGASGGEAGASLARDVTDLERVVRSYVDDFDFRSATLAVNSVVAGLNQYIEATRPWELARAGSAGELAGVLGFLLGAVRHVAEVAVPLIPSGAGRVLSLLTAAIGNTGLLAPAFPRLEMEAAGVLPPSH